MSGAGEVVALAESSVDLPKLGLVAEALVAAALAAAAADLLALGFPAGAEVHAAGLALLALAVGAQVARLAPAGTAVIHACRVEALVKVHSNQQSVQCFLNAKPFFFVVFVFFSEFCR